MGQRVPLCGALERHGHGVVRVLKIGDMVLRADADIPAILEHEVDGIKASERAGLRTLVVKRDGQGDDLALLDQLGSVDEFLRSNIIEGAKLIVRSPFAPILVFRGQGLHIVHRELFRHSSSPPRPFVFHIPRPPVNSRDSSA